MPRQTAMEVSASNPLWAIDKQESKLMVFPDP